MLLPAFGGALMLSVSPVLLQGDSGGFGGFLFVFGVMILGVSAFGREIGLKTFPFILTQPLERSRIWWTKISVLGVCTALVLCVWWVTVINNRPGMDSLEGLAWMTLMVVVLTTGAVWMTLLVRQMAAAFWLAYLVPALIGVAIKVMGGADWLLCTTLCLYSVAAFFLARRQFLNMQDTAWTGGALTFGRAPSVAGTSSLTRERGPWGTLFRKELKLHSFTIAGMIALFVVHLGVIAVRKFGANSISGFTQLALESFGLVWFVVPFVAGSLSVSEERQNGTLDGLLSLPVSRRAQFGIKLAFVLILGGVLSAVLLCGVETIANMAGAGTGPVVGNYFDLGQITIIFLALSLVGFYASTLTRSVAQALAAGAVVIGGFAFISNLAKQPDQADIVGARLWPVLVIPSLIVAILWLSYGNFKWTFESGRRWRGNIVSLAMVVILASTASAVVYHHAWGILEGAGPADAAHGPSIISAGKPATLRATIWNGLIVMLPDGRFWRDRDVDGSSFSGGVFAPGSNWVDAVQLLEETAAIRSDGTLWVSDKPGWKDKLVQFGTETNWRSVVRDTQYSVVLLKQDGTLWSLGPTEFAPTSFIKRGRVTSWGLGKEVHEGAYPGLGSFPPVRINADSDWRRMIHGTQSIYAWKRDGTAWYLTGIKQDKTWGVVPMPTLNRLRFKSGSSPFGLEVWIRDDGKLWWHEIEGSQIGSGYRTGVQELVQIGKDANWTQVMGGNQWLALKSDGTIWKWKRRRGESMQEFFGKPPVQLGSHNDWVGLGCWTGRPAALSADGALWVWPNQEEETPANSEGWLAPSTEPVKIENILSANVESTHEIAR